VHEERTGRVKAQVLRRKRRAVSQVADEKRLLEGKERIADAAANLFLNSGYHSTSVREVAQKAGLSVGSVFNYFTSKEEILFFIFSRNQERTEAILRDQQAEFERLKAEGVNPKELLWLAYQSYVRLVEELRRYIVLAYQELKSLTAVERHRLLDGETRIQHFLEEIIAYGVERGVFPPGNVDVKAHCLMVLSQSWAVRHWALKRFAKAEDYLFTLKTIVLGVVESETVPIAGVVAVNGGKPNEELLQSREP
jgi:TetR/AcrR family transcriptional regulator, cholesterol catabolism regulator